LALLDYCAVQHPDGSEDTRAIMTRLAEPLADHVKRCLERLL
jgi:hypothetical protein